MAVNELHTITADRIDPDAAKVVRRLSRYGHEAFLVGGCVRDLLCGRQPKDFDVSTSATPVEIRKLFRNCRIIGRRFRLAHIFFGDKIIETSTFRAMPAEEERAVEPPSEGTREERPELMIRRDNTFGNQEEDARRRDFTVNGLFYDLVHEQVIDHVNGLDDLRGQRIRTIGDPRIRFQEDPVRILRAVKFAARLGFSIEDATESAMMEFRALIAECSPARVLEEIYRLLGCGHSEEAVRLMQRTGVLAVLLPELQALLSPPPSALARALVAPIRAVGSNPGLSLDDLARDVEPEFVRVEGAAEPAPGPAPEPLAAAEAPPPVRRAPRPSPEEERAAVEHLLRVLFRDDPRAREQAATWLWGHLRAIDEWLVGPRSRDRVAPADGDAGQASPSPAPGHALLLANVFYGLTARSLDRELEAPEAQDLIEALIQGAAVRLGVSRKDRERLLQLLVMQRRLVHPGRRARPLALAKRESFQEAFTLLELHHHGVGELAETVERWHRLLDGETAPAGTRRRRRRRRRGRPAEARSAPAPEPTQGS
jgi:poly(A) polymerase